MPYARLDERNRIIEWSYDKLDGLDVEFSNGDYVNETCVDGLDDFVITGGEAVFDPTPEKRVKHLKKLLADTDYVAAKIAEGDATREEYADVLAQRKEWRRQINELAVGGGK